MMPLRATRIQVHAQAMDGSSAYQWPNLIVLSVFLTAFETEAALQENIRFAARQNRFRGPCLQTSQLPTEGRMVPFEILSLVAVQASAVSQLNTYVLLVSPPIVESSPEMKENSNC